MLHQLLEFISIITLFICLDNILFARAWLQAHRVLAVVILLTALIGNIVLYSHNNFIAIVN
jgi:hypothetical protein